MRRRFLLKTSSILMALILAAGSVPAGSFPLFPGSFVTALAAVSNNGFSVSLSGERFPAGSLPYGSSYIVKGILSANRTIAKVYGGIYNSDGKTKVIYHETIPGGTSCNLKDTFDPYLTFNKLALGNYLYKIEAVDTSGNAVTVISSYFSISKNNLIPSDISVVKASLPADTLPAGTMFDVRGQLVSSYPLQKVWGGIYLAGGSATGSYHEVQPNTSTYDLTGFDNYIAFNQLSAGSYIYRIQATDSTGYTKTVIEKKFQIVNGQTAPSDLQVYDATYPTGTLIQGKGFLIKGDVCSTYAIQSLTGGIYKAAGSTGNYQNQYVTTIKNGDIPKLKDSKVLSLTLIDNSLLFDKLPEGDYYYKVTATDSKGYSRELINSPFRIRSNVRDANSPQIVMKGIDVSAHQEEIDWNKVKADGIDFVILRAGATNLSDANYYQDSYFERNYSEAKRVGLKVGVYIYTSAFNKSEMKSNIDSLMETIKGKTMDMPVYIDVETEGRQPVIGKEAMTEMVKYGCELINAKGYQSGVYTGYNWFRDYIDTDKLRDTNCDIWLAIWPSNPDSFDYSDFCLTWQYCSDGKVNGISGNVDMDYRYAAVSATKYKVSLIQSEHGTISTDKTSADAGDRVTITAVPQKDYCVKSVRYGDNVASKNADGTYSFTMPSADVTVSVTYEFTDGISARLEGYSLSLDGDIGVNFYLTLSPEIIASQYSYLQFTLPGGEKPFILVKDAPQENGYYVFRCRVAAKDINTPIYAQIFDRGRSGTRYQFSVKNYADYILGHTNQTSYAKAAKVVKALLNYGTYAQNYFGMTTPPANIGLSVSDMKLSDVSAADINLPFKEDSLSLPEGVAFSGASLSLESKIVLSLYFSSSQPLNFQINGKNITTTQKEGYQVAELDQIRVNELGKDFHITVKSGSEVGSMVYSPLNYCYDVIKNHQGQIALGNLVKALYLYYTAASEYAGLK